MNIHNITTYDMNNGDGLRTVLWVSGCTHHCKECQNPCTWDVNDGVPFDEKAKKELFDDLSEDRFGKKHQEEAEAIAKSLDALHKIMEENGKATTTKKYDPVKIPDDFLERLLRRSRRYIANL